MHLHGYFQLIKCRHWICSSVIVDLDNVIFSADSGRTFLHGALDPADDTCFFSVQEQFDGFFRCDSRHGSNVSEYGAFSAPCCSQNRGHTSCGEYLNRIERSSAV